VDKSRYPNGLPFFRLGTVYFGRIVADEIKSKVSVLAPYIKANATLSTKIAAGTL
jgi:hypothetical protein